jgi:hypothetical protein
LLTMADEGVTPMVFNFDRCRSIEDILQRSLLTDQ